jgi:hypothetical protein
MKHPTQEQLIDFHCAEAAPEQAADIARHLAGCAECRVRVEAWRAVQRQLATWNLPETSRTQAAPTRSSRFRSTMRWAAAAAVLLLAGFGAARLTTPTSHPDTEAWRARMARELREELRSELKQFSAGQETRQEQFQEALTRTLGELEARRMAEYVGLRRDVETVAVRAEDELLDTREGLARLAASTPRRSTE